MSLLGSKLSNGFQFHFKLKTNSPRWLKALTWLTLPRFSKLVLSGFPDGLPCCSWSMQACPLPEDQESQRRLIAWICCLQYQKIFFPLPLFTFSTMHSVATLKWQQHPPLLNFSVLLLLSLEDDLDNSVPSMTF